MDIIVGIGEYAVSNNQNAVLKTFALSSCVALTVYSPLRRAAGMVHIALPFCPSAESGSKRPCYYATTAVPFIINKFCTEFDCFKSELEIKLFGGADSLRENDVFNIGQRNIDMVRKILSEMNLRYSSPEIGGTTSRTIEMEVATGRIKVLMQPIKVPI